MNEPKIDENWLQNFNKDSIVLKAYKYAKTKHENIFRESGEPYFNHLLRVAKTIYDWNLDEDSIAAAFLHDTVEDTKTEILEIKNLFNEEIAFLVDGLTKIKEIKYKNKLILDNDKEIEKIEAENFRKLLFSFCKDLRVLIIKLADRYDNLQTLYALPEVRQKKYAIETLDIYAPLAHRLGMNKLSSELEDLAFFYAYPDEYKWLIENIKEKYEEREKYIEKIKPEIEKILNENNIKPIEIQARAKRYYSLYKKLLRENMKIDEIYDLIAIRIILKTVEECYLTLGIIHKHFPPLPQKIKDYIARPKLNGYRSLHTTVFCFENKITEFQIRTLEMHKEAEYGIAAHWAYNEIKLNKDYSVWHKKFNQKEFEWIKQLQEWEKNFTNSKNFLKDITEEFFKDRIYVLTPKNDIIELAKDSTPIDFAYKIHTELGNQCISARVNNKIVPLDYKLQSGDIIEINIQKGKKPSLQWLEFVKMPSTKEKILKTLKNKDKNLKQTIKKQLLEIKITSFDRQGYLKDITNIFHEMKINILNLNSQVSKNNMAKTIIKINILPDEKIKKLIQKIKNVKDTQDVNYKIV